MASQQLERRLNAYYILIQGLFWMCYAGIWGFAAVFLQGKGFSNGEIGAATALGSVGSVLLQLWMGSLTEKAEWITARILAMICSLCMCTGVFFLFFIRGTFPVAILFFVAASVSACEPAILNAVAMEYINMGITLKYELARGSGSIAFAAGALIYGRIAEIINSRFIMLLCLLESIVLFLLLINLPDNKEIAEKYGLSLQKLEMTESGGGFIQVLKEKKKLLVLFAGIIFLFVGHNTLNTYLINIVENIGGGETEMGIANAVTAAIELPGMLLGGCLLLKFSGGNILRFAAVMFVIKSVLTLAARNVPMLIMAQLFQMLAYGFFTPVSVYYINSVIPISYRVSGQTALGIAVLGLGGFFGNLCGGLLLDIASTSAMLFFCTLCSIVGGFLLFAGTKANRKKE